MPTVPDPRITAWSYSRWRDYEECPAKAKYKYVDKLREPDSPAMARGTLIHKLAENWLLSPTRKPLPTELENFAQEFKTLRRMRGVLPEQQWAFTNTWEPTGWFDGNACVRVKVDASAMKLNRMALVVDFKTGKPRDSHTDQLSLYAIGSFICNPEALIVDTQLWYLDAGRQVDQSFKRSDLPDLKALWAMRTRALLNDRTFPPRPNETCRFCPFSKAKGGPCRY